MIPSDHRGRGFSFLIYILSRSYSSFIFLFFSSFLPFLFLFFFGGGEVRTAPDVQGVDGMGTTAHRTQDRDGMYFKDEMME